MKCFLQYLAEAIKQYEYRIRTIAPITDDSIERIKEVLDKYNLVSISKPKKTILQYSPLDFPEVQSAEVYIIDIKTTVPASSEMLVQEIRGALNIPRSELIVRSPNDPMELETIVQDSKSKGLKDSDTDPLLSSDPAYHEYPTDIDEPQAFGDDYNKRFLAYLAKIAADRKTIEAVVQPENQEKNAFGLMSELNNVSDDFNKDYDTPKPVPTSKADESAKEPADVSNEGSFITSKRLSKTLEN